MKLGVIGFGTRLAHMVNNCMREADAELTVVGVIDPNEEKVRSELPENEAKDVRFFNSVDEMVEAVKPDAIAIGTRCDLHTPYAIDAAATGLPVFLEKPVAINMEQAIALEEAFDASDSEVVVSFPLRASPLCQRVKQLLDQGVIGTPEHVLAQNYVPYGDVYFNSWYRDSKITGGLFLQKATHDLDYLSFCMRSPVVRVAAMKSCGRVFRDSAIHEQEREADCAYYEKIGSPESGMNEDSSSAMLEFANGAQGVYSQVFFAKRNAAARGAAFCGYRGTIKFDWFKNEATVNHHFDPFDDTISVDADLHHHGGDGILAENFIKVARGEASSISSIWSGLQSVYTCLAAFESSESGEFRDVRQVASRGGVESFSEG
ncbi:Gfo/Idh/MocA family oxidoreductase [Rubellicoccus peritrichatus]|uniref:Gfo/Idh/MocA family oxidoreductase n=1 Tax=Rubellicoccus peritrichatus TaxID=3080537 RepID=A0AAQ3L7K4_9BACT|nr:Gfo/Idh/MocA family oxidoreductase [Puniceicoccus sp. CR14]WOO40715.1 Gfo/Idh/MocA family oxidoreductase [Puniceicoccus sp. CR14]